jgi:hypothetical protein
MDDFLLRSRLEALCRTLSKVRVVRESLEQQRLEFHRLEDMLAPAPDTSIQRLAWTIKGAIDNLVAELEDREVHIEHPSLQPFIEEARLAAEKARAVRNQANTALTLVRTLDRRWVKLTDVKAGEALNNRFTAQTEQFEKIVKSIEDGPLARAAAAGAAGDDDQALTELREAWRRYEDEVLKTTKPLFEEYVDLLGGLALRALGFDLGVAQSADTLLIILEDRMELPNSSVAVPAHTQALRMTVARIIRLGFPGWTMWDLPLAAHEFGHVVADREEYRDAIREHAEELRQRWDALHDLAADLVQRWGTLTHQTTGGALERDVPRIGPALLEALADPDTPAAGEQLSAALAVAGLTEAGLAGALAGVRLIPVDVASAIAGMPVDENQLTALFAEAFATFALGPAYACASILQRFNPHDDSGARGTTLPDYARARMVLLTLRQAHSGAYDLIAAKLQTEWEAALAQAGVMSSAAHTLEGLQAWNDRVFDLLRRCAQPVHYSGATWDRVAGWVDRLLNGQEIRPDGTQDLRDMLNVAWVCRLGDPGRVDKISADVTSLWEEIRPRPKGGDPGPTPPWGG